MIDEGGPTRPVLTLAEAARCYELEIMPRKTARWNSRGSELYALRLVVEDELSAKSVAEIAPADLVAWRDRRLQTVSPASAQRYMNTLSSVLTACEKDWGLIDTTPCARSEGRQRLRHASAGHRLMR